MTRPTQGMLIGLLAALLTCSVWGQEASPETQPAGTDQPADVLALMTLERMQEAIETANVRRLALERRQAIAEIRQGLLYDPDDIDRAVALLESEAIVDRAANVRRIQRALALVDEPFAEAMRQLSAGQAKAAAEGVGKLIEPNETSLLAAARALLRAQALRQAKQTDAAVEAYRDLLTNMPERISFAATAAVQGAQAFDEAGRLRYAKEMYDYALDNYGLALTADEVEWVLDRLAALEPAYEEPLAVAAKMMGDAETRLAAADSGDQTQATQDRVIALLRDLIMTMEEQQQSQQNQQQQQQQQKQQRKGQGDGRQKQPEDGPSPEQPSSPMTDSRLVPGRVPAPTRLSTIHEATESGDWATLPPRQRQKIQQIMRRSISQRYRRLVSDYHRRLSEEGSE